MASDNNSLIDNIIDFNHRLQNSLLQLRARNPFINQKKFMMNQMDRFLRSTANIEIRNQEDLKRVKRYLQKALNMRHSAERIMDIENKKLLRSNTDLERGNVRRKGKPFFDKEAELSIRTTQLLNKIKEYESSQSIAINNPKYRGGKNIPPNNAVIGALIKSPQYMARQKKNGAHNKNGNSGGKALKSLRY
ncbi:hypothetical protein GCM10009430_12060 [Aquimarina litoralis]|uniref:Uncharacterized protein n=1 Tax=Aquimarina litoralis TaxID=584605 RepID=A0ABP3TTW4_9FLAO